MHRQVSNGATASQHGNVRIWWSAEDDAFLAEVEGVPGSLTHGDTPDEARNSALEAAEECRVLGEWLAHLSLDDYVTFRRIEPTTSERLRARATPGPERRSLAEWNELLAALRHPADATSG